MVPKMYDTWCLSVSPDILRIPDIPTIPDVPDIPDIPNLLPRKIWRSLLQNWPSYYNF